jgi:hypothetical protein
MQLITAIAAIAVTTATVHAHFANINNYCDFEVYVWPTDGDRNPSSGTPIPPGSNWWEEYRTVSTGGGVSLKITTSNNLGPITQFEYTVSNWLGEDHWDIFYDGSNIDCKTTNCPFWEYNLYIGASDESCSAGPCPAKTECPGFYQKPDDDQCTFSCPMSANTTMHLCVPDHLLPTSQKSVPIPPPQPSLVKAQQSVPAKVQSSSDQVQPSPSTTTPPPVQINQAIVETTITVTTTTWLRNRFAPRHAHAQHHDHA